MKLEYLERTMVSIIRGFLFFGDYLILLVLFHLLQISHHVFKYTKIGKQTKYY